MYLLRFYETILAEEKKIRQKILLTMIKMLKILKKKYSAEREYDETKEKWSYKWRDGEIKRGYELYCQHGRRLQLITDFMKSYYQQNHNYKFNSNRICSMLQHLQRQGIIIVFHRMKERHCGDEQFECEPGRWLIDDCLVKRSDPEFEFTCRLMKIGLEKNGSNEEIEEVYSSIMRTMEGKKKSWDTFENKI